MQNCPEILIVFYDRMYHSPLELERFAVPGVRFSEDRALVQSADAVVIHAPQDCYRKRPIMSKPQGQLWVAWSLESAVNYPQINDPIWDLRMTYQRDADVWIPYFANYGGDFLAQLRQPVPPKQPGCLVASFISSPFDRSGRLAYLKELSKYVDVHHYGKHRRNRFLADTGRATKLEVFRRYKCVIAFENSISTDYVTEKYYDALLTGAVPVYLGAPNIADYSPAARCHIDVNDYGSPRELADYLLALDQDDTIRESLLVWKQLPFRKDFVAMVRSVLEAPHPFVRLAEAVKLRLATTEPSANAAHKFGAGQRFSNGRGMTESRTYLLSYPRSGSSWVRYIVEYLSGRKTMGCGPNAEDIPLYMNNLKHNPLHHVNAALAPILYKSNGERTLDFSKCDKLVLITMNPAAAILRHRGRLNQADIEDYINILKSYDKFKSDNKHLIIYEDLIAEPRKIVSDLVEFLGIDKQKVDEFFENYHYHRKAGLTLYMAVSRATKTHAK